jgi:hypothetical protein
LPPSARFLEEPIRSACRRSEGLGACLRTFCWCVTKPISQFAKRNEPARRFVPQHEANARKTLAQREPADVRELGVIAKSERQTVKRNSAAEVMDMMYADIRGEPSQDGG